MDQDATWYGVSLGPGHIVLDGNPAPPRKGAQQTPTFRPMSIVAKRSPISATAKLLYLTKCQLLYDIICCHYVSYVHWRTSWICSPVFEAKCVQFHVQKFFWSFSTASCGYVCNEFFHVRFTWKEWPAGNQFLAHRCFRAMENVKIIIIVITNLFTPQLSRPILKIMDVMNFDDFDG